MIVRNIADLLGTERDVEAENWSSCRLLLKQDGMGFSLHDTVIHPGTSTEMHYKNHLEAVYCIEGVGRLKDVETGEEHTISPGIMYALCDHDRHVLTAESKLRMICVFNPPVTGRETHDEDGAYPANGD